MTANTDTNPKTLNLGTRSSPLALRQSETVAARLRDCHAEIKVDLVRIQTTGDRSLDTSLTTPLDKGMFTTEIENALLAGEIDFAVHSLKDLPTEMAEGLTLAAICQRADARDALIAKRRNSLMALPRGGKVATSSQRRRAQVLALRRDLNVVEVRGNVGTRLNKFAESDWDAMILATAGLVRLNLRNRITAVLPVGTMLPAPGQGALAVQCRADDHATQNILSCLNDPDTHDAVLAERAFLAGLGGGCQIPVGAYGQVENDTLTLQGLVAAPDGQRVIRDRIAGPRSSPLKVGANLAAQMNEAGAAHLLRPIGPPREGTS